MSTPTNIPETLMGETEQDSYPKSKEKFQQQLQDIFQKILRLTGPDQFDQLCQWMQYKQYLTIDDFYDNSCYDPEKFDTKGPATEYKWKGKMNHLSANVAQKLKSFVRWMTHEDRPYELHDDFLATLTRERYLKFRHMDTLSFLTSSPSHHEPHKHQVKKGPQRKAFFSQQEEISDDNEYANAEEQFSTDPKPEEHSPYSVYQSSFQPKMPQKSFLPPNTLETLSESTKQMNIEHNKKVKLNTLHHTLVGARLNLTLHWVNLLLPHNKFINIHRMNLVMTWIPQTPQVQYQPLSKLPVMTHPTPSVLIAYWKPSAIIPSTPS